MRRVSVENLRPDYHGEEVIEEGYIEPDQNNDRFAEVETPAKENIKERDIETS